jgi:hypothetical protein
MKHTLHSLMPEHKTALSRRQFVTGVGVAGA